MVTKTKPTTIYKVCFVDTDNNNEFISCCRNLSFTYHVKYKLGVISKAHKLFRGSKLFVFDNKDSAENFICNHSQRCFNRTFVLLECTTNKVYTPKIQGIPLLDSCHKFWEAYVTNNKVDITNYTSFWDYLPDNTKFVTSLTPVSIISYYKHGLPISSLEK